MGILPMNHGLEARATIYVDRVFKNPLSLRRSVDNFSGFGGAGK
jgi:hypothetical protein